MPQVILKRKYTKSQTYGIMNFNGVTIPTIELPWKENKRGISCIPEGEYQVVLRNTPKRGDHYHVLNVPNRTWILFHDRVNFIGSQNPSTDKSDIQGCIIPYFSLKDLNKDGILDIAPKSSTNAMQKMLKHFPKAFTLKIYS